MDKTEFIKITYRDDMGGYAVNRLGQLMNLKTGLVLKGTVDRNGYLRYSVILDSGKHSTIAAHLVVANEFLPKAEDKPCVNHIDEDKLNCDIDNLEWCTHKENANHATCQERRSKNRKRPVNEYDLDGHYIRTWKSAGDVGDFLREVLGKKVEAADAIWKCCKGKQCIALGRVWRYYDGRTEGVILAGSDMPMRKYRRWDWDIMQNVESVPDEYLYEKISTEEVARYFMETSKLSKPEKQMLKETFKELGVDVA